ncbi:hypothetical protein THAOC_36329, partial [Thalassiosira oceanica]
MTSRPSGTRFSSNTETKLGPHTGWVKDLAAVTTPGGDGRDAMQHRLQLRGGVVKRVPPHPPVAESEENDAVPRVLVGTKRGVLKELRIDRLDGRTGGWTARDISDASGVALKPYPIYSMLELGGRVLAGGGDRHVTVWNETSPGLWSVSQRLGPVGLLAASRGAAGRSASPAS